MDVGLVIFFAGTLALTAFVAWASYRSAQMLQQMGEVDFNLLLLPSENLLRLGMVLACLVFGWISGLPRDQFGWISYAPLSDTAIGLGAGVAIQVPLNALTNWAVGRFGPQIYSPVVIRSILPRTQDEWPPVLLALFPAVLVEELLFRSLWLGGVGLFIPIPALLIGTALVFGWMHSPQGRLGMLMTGAVSVLLAGIFLWRESLLPALVAHYVLNVLQLLVAHRHRNRL